MAADDAMRRRSRLFTVRVWSEATGGTEQRGRVRDVETGAFRSFRSWEDLTGFLAGQLEEPGPLPDHQKPDHQKPDHRKPDDQKPDHQKPDHQKMEEDVT